jgi:hypothetical protein
MREEVGNKKKTRRGRTNVLVTTIFTPTTSTLVLEVVAEVITRTTATTSVIRTSVVAAISGIRGGGRTSIA